MKRSQPSGKLLINADGSVTVPASAIAGAVVPLLRQIQVILAEAEPGAPAARALLAAEPGA